MSIVNHIRESIVVALDKHFPSAKIYGEEIQQGFQEPCFFIKILNPAQRQIMGSRYFREHPFDIHYFPSKEGDNEEMNDVANQLFRILEYIVFDGDSVRGTDVHYEIIDRVLHFFVDYNLYLVKTEQKEYMENLELHSTTKG